MRIAQHILHVLNCFFSHLIKYLSFRSLAAVFIAPFLMPSISHAELRSMSASEMKASTGQAGFTEFAVSDNSTRLFLDIHIETYTTIDTFSIGNDLQWDDVQIGNSNEDLLQIDGLVFITNFDTKGNLESVVFGSNRLQGDITSTMTSYSGGYNPALTNDTGDMIIANGESLNNNEPLTFNFDSNANATTNMGLYFVLSPDGAKVVAGYDEASLSTDPWWNSP